MQDFLEQVCATLHFRFVVQRALTYVSAQDGGKTLRVGIIDTVGRRIIKNKLYK